MVESGVKVQGLGFSSFTAFVDTAEDSGPRLGIIDTAQAYHILGYSKYPAQVVQHT